MTISKEIKDKALEIGRKHKLAKVWVNEVVKCSLKNNLQKHR